MANKEIKETDNLIKDAKEFMALWVKFHDLYKEAVKDKVISAEEEKNFLETQSVIARRYQALSDRIGIDSSREDKTFDVILSILSLGSVSSLSDMQLAKIEQDWHNSYISLNRLIGGLDTKRERLLSDNSIDLRFAKSLKPLLSFIIVVSAIVAAYIILINIFHVDSMIRDFILKLRRG